MVASVGGAIPIAIVFRGDRGLELDDARPGASQIIAIVFRGDRGLEQEYPSLIKAHNRLRSSFGAIEDWNRGDPTISPDRLTIAIVFRGDRGLELSRCQVSKTILRIAIVFRGDRGLELRLRLRLRLPLRHCDRLSGRSRIGTYTKK